MTNKHNLPLYKRLILIFLIIYFFFEIFYYTYMFQVSSFESIDIVAFCAGLLMEFSLISLFILIIYRANLLLKYFASILFFGYVVIHILQSTSIYISGEYVSKLAIDNLEFIGLLITTENILLVLLFLILFLLLPFIVSYKITKNRVVSRQFLDKYLILLIVLFIGSSIFLTVYKNTSASHKSKVSVLSPIWGFIYIFQEEKEITNLSFTKDELQTLQKYGYYVNPFSEYPLIKDVIYKNSLDLNSSIAKPNVIVIFTEGLSAVTTSVYNDTFKDLTPNLEIFANDNKSTKVYNYYNHTAATYRGLFGQMCSTYPWLGGGKSWVKNNGLNLSENSYKCIPHILNNNGYDTVYLNMHYKDSSGNDEMARNFGFDKVLSGEVLSEKYLGGIDKIRKDYIDDQHAYKTLISYLKENENNSKPFFLATYTIETHAFVDITSDGVGYNDGKNNVLNTIHNMDNAFGKFWRYFKQSKFSKNTIVIFTSDHARYFCTEYRKTMQAYKETNYHSIFIDRVPMLMYIPHTKIPSTFNAHQSTSVDLTPTILQLLGVKQESNAFLGHSIFQNDRELIGVASFGSSFYLIKENNLIYGKNNVLSEDKSRFDVIRKFIMYLHELEKKNKLFKPYSK